MLKRQRRVSKSLFPLFQGPSGSFFSGPITLRVTRNKITEPTRFSVVVSKKVAPKAVVRNRIRRKILGVAREFILKSKPGFVCLLYPKMEVKTLSSVEIHKHLKKIFISAGLL
jgi:ribonuclease P protein component